MNKITFRMMIKALNFMMGKYCPSLIKVMLSFLHQNQPSFIGMLNMSTENAERLVHPKEAVIPEIIQQVHPMLLNDQKLKVRDIFETESILIDDKLIITDEKALCIMGFLNFKLTQTKKYNESTNKLAPIPAAEVSATFSNKETW